MSDHLSTILGMLRAAIPSTLTVYDTDASSAAGKSTAYPYLVVSGGVAPPDYDALGACSTGASGLVRVTSVALDPAAVRRLVTSTRGVLEQVRLPVPGGVEIQLWDAQGIEVDRDVKLMPGTTAAYPFYAVDIYRVRSAI